MVHSFSSVIPFWCAFLVWDGTWRWFYCDSVYTFCKYPNNMLFTWFYSCCIIYAHQNTHTHTYGIFFLSTFIWVFFIFIYHFFSLSIPPFFLFHEYMHTLCSISMHYALFVCIFTIFHEFLPRNNNNTILC